MLKALIFDMDGTLIDSERVHFQAWCRNLAGHRVEPPGFHLFADYVGASDEQMAGDFIEAYRLKVSVAELVSAKQALYRELVPQICLLPGVRQVIHRFHGRYRLAVASSSPCAELIEILEFHQLRDYFEQIVGGDMAANKKPQPDIYLRALHLLDLAPGQCVAFEDSQTGVMAAKRAGLYAVAIPHEMSREHDFSGADALIHGLAGLDDSLLAMLEASAPELPRPPYPV